MGHCWYCQRGLGHCSSSGTGRVWLFIHWHYYTIIVTVCSSLSIYISSITRAFSFAWDTDHLSQIVTLSSICYLPQVLIIWFYGKKKSAMPHNFDFWICMWLRLSHNIVGRGMWKNHLNVNNSVDWWWGESLWVYLWYMLQALSLWCVYLNVGVGGIMTQTNISNVECGI